MNAQRVPGDRPRRNGEDVVEFAVATHRIPRDRAGHYRTRLKSGAVSERTIESLAPGVPLLTPTGMRRVAAAPFRAPGTTGIDPYSLTPLPDELKVTHPALHRLAREEDPHPPSLFEQGDLPTWTASGMDPQLLARLPWQARHPVAGEGDGGRAFALFERYVNDPDGAREEFGRHTGNTDYVIRVQAWAAGTTATGERDVEPQVRATVGSETALDALGDSIPRSEETLAALDREDRARAAEAASRESAALAERVRTSAEARITARRDGHSGTRRTSARE